MSEDPIDFQDPKEALKMIRENFEALLQGQASLAILLRARYGALVAADFSEEQAFEIIKHRGLG